jgi:hypothetical protein
MSKQKYKKVIQEIPIVDHKAILVTIHQEVGVEAIVVVIEEVIVEVETINDVVVVVGSIKIIHQHLPEEMIITKFHNNNNNNNNN